MMNVYISWKHKQERQHKTHQIIRFNKSTVGDRGLIQIIGLRDLQSKFKKKWKQFVLLLFWEEPQSAIRIEKFRIWKIDLPYVYRLAYRTAYRPTWGSIVQIPTAVFTVRKDGIGRRGKELQCSLMHFNNHI